MAYTEFNYKTKKAVKEALKAGKVIRVYQPNGDLFGIGPLNGKVYLEGPHYPEPHRWYAQGEVINGILTKII